jgi:hypothetical protein
MADPKWRWVATAMPEELLAFEGFPASVAAHASVTRNAAIALLGIGPKTTPSNRKIISRIFGNRRAELAAALAMPNPPPPKGSLERKQKVSDE